MLRLTLLVALATSFGSCTKGAPSSTKPDETTEETSAPTEAPPLAKISADDALVPPPEAATPAPTSALDVEQERLHSEVCQLATKDGALGIVRVTRATSDCSSVGGRILLFDLVESPTHQGSATLYDRVDLMAQSPRVGDLLVVRFELQALPAATSFCVSLPKRDGFVRDSVAIPDLESGRAALAAAGSGSCPAEASGLRDKTDRNLSR